MTVPGPVFEHVFEIFEFEEILLRISFYGGFTADHRDGIFQVGRGIGGPAVFAIVAILISGAAIGAFTLDKAIRQEHISLRIVSLGNDAGPNMPGFAQLGVYVLGKLTVFR